LIPWLTTCARKFGRQVPQWISLFIKTFFTTEGSFISTMLILDLWSWDQKFHSTSVRKMALNKSPWRSWYDFFPVITIFMTSFICPSVSMSAISVT
jgi:hypothetical protein